MTDGSPNGGVVKTAGNTWLETTITYNNRPAIGSVNYGRIGSATAGRWAIVDVTGAIQTAGTKTLVIYPQDINNLIFQSRENTHPPELVITYVP